MYRWLMIITHFSFTSFRLQNSNFRLFLFWNFFSGFFSDLKMKVSVMSNRNSERALIGWEKSCSELKISATVENESLTILFQRVFLLTKNIFLTVREKNWKSEEISKKFWRHKLGDLKLIFGEWRIKVDFIKIWTTKEGKAFNLTPLVIFEQFSYFLIISKRRWGSGSRVSRIWPLD